MKWVTRGTILSVAPFTLFYIIPYLFGGVPRPGMKVSVLSLVFLPLTFGYAIFRYRLMDVDLIFKRGMAYTIAAGAITRPTSRPMARLGILPPELPQRRTLGLVIAIAVTALLFDPFKNWVQDHLDKFFYRKRYDYRRTLIEFGRDLNSETDLDKMLTSIVDRLSRTLLVDRLAIFLANPEQPDSSAGEVVRHRRHRRTSIWTSCTSSARSGRPATCSSTTPTRPCARNPRRETDSPPGPELLHSLHVMNRIIAVLGLGKTAEGDFLSSEDVQLLERWLATSASPSRTLVCTLAGKKAAQYERLKEFNENIVESISVGVMAVDLEDRIESWNSQMEVMYALPRCRSAGPVAARRLPRRIPRRVLPRPASRGIHNLYKFRLSTTAGELA